MYLKLSESVKFELIPGDDLYIDKKNFTWVLSLLNENEIGFNLRFENPMYISSNALDTLKISLKNTENFLAPLDEEKSSIPDGFTIVIKVPP